MKRSEAVEILYSILKDHPVAGKYINRDEVSDLIQQIEDKIGMAPPPYTSDIYLRSECAFAEVNEWESEEEIPKSGAV
jgi:hypothetical protein